MENTENTQTRIDPATIDWPATKHALRLYKLSALSRDMDEVHGTMSLILLGKYPSNGLVFQRVVRKLRDRGFLVLKQSPEQQAA